MIGAQIKIKWLLPGIKASIKLVKYFGPEEKNMYQKKMGLLFRKKCRDKDNPTELPIEIDKEQCLFLFPEQKAFPDTHNHHYLVSFTLSHEY